MPRFTKTAVIEPSPAVDFSAIASSFRILLFTCRTGISDLTVITDGFKTNPDLAALLTAPTVFRLIRSLNLAEVSGLRRFLAQLADGTKSVLEVEYSPDGAAAWFLRLTVTPGVGDNGEPVYFGLVEDLTGDREMLTRLQRSEEKLRMLFEAAEDLIFVLDFRGNFTSINNYGALSLEYIPEEIIGRHFLEFIEESNKAGVARSFQEILKLNQVVTFEAAFMTKYGKSVIIELNTRATYDHERIENVIGIGRNITLRKQEQEKMKELNNKFIEANRIISIERDRAKQRVSVLEELNKLKNEFVSNISHEFRTPLASIIGFSETLDSDEAMPPEMRKEFNQIILNEAKRLSKLINDVLDISRIEEGRIALERTEFEITGILRPLLEKNRLKAEAKHLVFSYELPEGEVLVMADRERIEQVFDNLFANAVKFTNEGGRVTVFAQLLYKEIEVIISDTGIGIPKKDLPYIFQKFYRVSRPGSEIPGTGLGLALVKQILDLHKGMITVQSEENKGTTFVVKLPYMSKR